MELKDILYGVSLREVSGTTHLEIGAITFDSRNVESNALFFAVRGTHVDGHEYIDQAILNGAIAIIVEDFPEQLKENTTYIKVDDSAHALGIAASNFFGNPSENLKLVGVTGTNGKTTTVTLLHELFTHLGHVAGVLSTVENKIGDRVVPATHTTPDPVQLNALLADMVEFGCEYCFMEVSSHAVDQKRISGLHFKGAVFSNISRDHLDYHKTFDAYIKAKKGFFDGLSKDAFALYNSDDKNGQVMMQNTSANIFSYGVKSIADIKGKIIENNFSGLVLNIENMEVWTRLIGSFNAYNLLAVYGVAKLLEQDTMEVLTGLSKLKSVEGRFQYIKSQEGIIAIVDYAHTPDALENVLKTIHNIRTGNETVYTLLGCGGDRDTGKRPLMAKIATEWSDKVIFTSDNPRSEDPETIIEDMKKGVEPQNFKKTLSITNRKEAIKTACMMAEKDDIILIAGKGHEKYQEIKGKKYPFDDLKIVKDSLQNINK